MQTARHILPIIVIAQFCCTSLWFAGNGVLTELITTFNLNNEALGTLTSAVQLGFIAGTLLFAILTISDKYNPSLVFFICALAGAGVNALTLISENTIVTLTIIRGATGFFLAGIYPVGMKIASDYFDKGLGKSLGYLVGALVLGTAFPHATKAFVGTFDWRLVLIITSGMAVIGGLLILLFVKRGPFQQPLKEVKLNAFFKVFRNKDLKVAAYGYFGHMWELYAFWAFLPLLLFRYIEFNPEISTNISLWSFIIIAIGSLGCITGGYISEAIGMKKTASIALLISGICCLISPFILNLSFPLFIGFLLIWGISVITDSPLFSALVAKNASNQLKGTALTIVTSMGFAISIISIQLLSFLSKHIAIEYCFVFLALGPIIGLISLFRKA
jgi:MFS family permease